MKLKITETCKDLLIGILLYSVVVSVLGAIISFLVAHHWLSFVLGVLLGGAISVVLAIHMDSSIVRAVMMEQKQASKFSSKMAVIRYVIMAAALILALTFPSAFQIYGVLLGILALKFAAYLQPVTSKYISNKLCSKGR